MSDPHFVGILRLEPDTSDPTGLTLVVASKSFAFFDSKGTEWEARPGDITDGASIPAIFKPLIGQSFNEFYLEPATLHDIYCKNKTRTWLATDAMFYEALVTKGVSRPRAWIMYLAVVIGGPHW